MTALAQNSTPYSHPTGNPTRRGGSLILRNVHIFVGALCLFHDDGVAASSRLMPARSLDNANTAAQGGPLQVPGADANGGLRLISRQPRVLYNQTVAGAGSLTVSVLQPGNYRTIAVSAPAATTAGDIAKAIRANPEAFALVDVTPTGTWSGVAVTFSQAQVPFVRLAGFAKKEYDASIAAYVSTDMPVTEIIELDTGIGFMANDATDPASANDVGGPISILDDQTIARTQAFLQLPAFLFDWQPAHAGAQGPCIRIP